MSRYSRSQFVAYGVLNLLNAIALLIYGLGLATHGTGGASDAIPVLIIVAAICLLSALVALVKRGYDLGRPAWQTILGFWLSLCLGPAALFFIGYLACAIGNKEQNQYGSPSARPVAAIFVWAVLVLVCPWLVVVIAGLIYGL